MCFTFLPCPGELKIFGEGEALTDWQDRER